VTLQDFPGLNATLNASSAALQLTAWAFIKTGRREAHRLAVLAALACSAAFLSCYLYYHAHVGSVRFPGTGALRTFYLALLLSHTVLAVVILPVILRTLYLAAKGRFAEHRRWARWAMPAWMYVSVTGVTVYWMLYRL
jgi:putative membrane protein